MTDGSVDVDRCIAATDAWGRVLREDDRANFECVTDLTWAVGDETRHLLGQSASPDAPTPEIASYNVVLQSRAIVRRMLPFEARDLVARALADLPAGRDPAAAADAVLAALADAMKGQMDSFPLPALPRPPAEGTVAP